MLVVLVLALVEPFLANLLTALAGPRVSREPPRSAAAPTGRGGAGVPAEAAAS